MEVIFAAVKSFDANITISGNFVLNAKKLYAKRKESQISCETETALACFTKCTKYMKLSVLETSLPSHVILASGISAKIWCVAVYYIIVGYSRGSFSSRLHILN